MIVAGLAETQADRSPIDCNSMDSEEPEMTSEKAGSCTCPDDYPVTLGHMTSCPRHEPAVDFDPTPWCSYGHRTEADCDCGPIADNE